MQHPEECTAYHTGRIYSGKRNVTVQRPSVRLSDRRILNVTHQGQQMTRPAYISARQSGGPTVVL